MLLLALACAACAVELWTRPKLRAWLAAGGINTLMIGVHLVLMGRSPTMPMHAAHGGGMEMPGSHASHLMTFAMALAFAEVAIAVTVLALERRTTGDRC